MGAHEGGLRWEILANRGVSCQERGGVAHKGGHRKPLINMGVRLLHKVPNKLGSLGFLSISFLRVGNVLLLTEKSFYFEFEL